MQTIPGGATMSRTLLLAWAEGGISAVFLPGLVASMAREVISSGARAGLYCPVRDALASARGTPPTSNDIVSKVGAALVTGCIGSLLANPVDVVKIRLQKAPGLYGGSLTSGLVTIARSEGATGLYRGLAPSTLRAAAIAVAELSSYDITKSALRSHSGLEEGPALHVVASLVAGGLAAVVAAPFDLAKAVAMDTRGAPKGLGDVVRELRHAGSFPFGLFRGVLPAYLRLGPHAFICLPLLEAFRDALGLPPI